MKASGFKSKIEYKKPRERNLQQHEAKRRSRKVTWFNPPYSCNVETNVGKSFLRLVDTHFPTSHKLHKIFNRKTLKVSYSCMENVTQIIKKHNRKIIQPNLTTITSACNCREKPNCPLNDACLTKGTVYMAEVTTQDQKRKQYIGMTENDFKGRFNVHKQSFNKPKYENSTSLSKYIWELKRTNTNYDIKWSILKRAKAYVACSRDCNLCRAEKLCIVNADKRKLLNKRSELISKCRHENKFHACNYKPD